MNIIATRVEELRINSGMKKKELAKQVGVSVNTIYFWNRTNSMPTLPVIEKICEVFKITVEQFFHGLGNKDSDRQEAEFLDGWRLLTEGEKAAVSAVIAEFKKLRKAVEND